MKKDSVANWKKKAIGNTVSGGGSNSRSVPLAASIITNYNINLPVEQMIDIKTGAR